MYYSVDRAQITAKTSPGLNWQEQAIDLCSSAQRCDASADRWRESGGGDVEGGGGQSAALWNKLRNAYARQPLDGTFETGPVLLRLLKDGLIGSVSFTL